MGVIRVMDEVPFGEFSGFEKLCTAFNFVTILSRLSEASSLLRPGDGEHIFPLSRQRNDH